MVLYSILNMLLLFQDTASILNSYYVDKANKYAITYPTNWHIIIDKNSKADIGFVPNLNDFSNVSIWLTVMKENEKDEVLSNLFIQQFHYTFPNVKDNDSNIVITLKEKFNNDTYHIISGVYLNKKFVMHETIFDGIQLIMFCAYQTKDDIQLTYDMFKTVRGLKN